jgi:AcrR family transcriptional regulator
MSSDVEHVRSERVVVAGGRRRHPAGVESGRASTLAVVARNPAPAPRLTKQAVLAEAMALLDDEGDEALTMRRLADRLGVVPMAIYRHVADKDELIDGVLDLAVSQVELPSSRLGWRAGLRELGHSVRRTMLAHPAIVATLVTRPSLGAHGLAIGEYGLGVMLDAGFSVEHADRGPKAVLTYTIGFVALEVPRRRQGFSADGREAPGLDLPVEQLDPARFPHTIAVRPRAAEFVSDDQFDYGLERVLDGLAAMQPARPTATVRGGATRRR